MMRHKWVHYDLQDAQIRYFEFESDDGVVRVTKEAVEGVLRERGYEPEDEFNAKIDRLVKALYEAADEQPK